MDCRLARRSCTKRGKAEMITEEKDPMKQLNHSLTMSWEGSQKDFNEGKTIVGGILPAQTGNLMQISMITCINQPTRGNDFTQYSRIKMDVQH